MPRKKTSDGGSADDLRKLRAIRSLSTPLPPSTAAGRLELIGKIVSGAVDPGRANIAVLRREIAESLAKARPKPKPKPEPEEREESGGQDRGDPGGATRAEE